MLIILRIKCRFPDYSLAPNASRAHYRYTNKENDMNKKLIQQLLDDDETRDQIALMIDEVGTSAEFRGIGIQGILRKALNKLNDTPMEGDMVTIEALLPVRVRGAYIRTRDGGVVDVSVAGHVSSGKRVDLVVKGEEGEADV
jgi:hypothetical protein